MVVFFISLAAFLCAFVIGDLIISAIPPAPVIKAIDPPFKICGSKTVQPGRAIGYRIHYYKFKDVPGDLVKQLIVKPFDGSEEVYIPLRDISGHLPIGDVVKKAYVSIPEWTPEGKAVLKLTASYQNVKNPPPPVVAYTEPFEIRK
jgi:hypothetical protein